jgi:hypothetical protein
VIDTAIFYHIKTKAQTGVYETGLKKPEQIIFLKPV